MERNRAEIAQEQDNLANARQMVADFKRSLFDMYKSHLEMISAMPDTEEAHDVTAEDIARDVAPTEEQVAAAAAAYKEVLAEDAANGMASLRLGAALKATGDKEGAVAAFQAAIENGQDKAGTKQIVNLYQQEAAAALKAKKYDDAIAAALESAKYDADNAKAFQIAGTAASNGGKTKQAIEYFEKYLELAPTAKNSGDILFSIGVSYQQLKDNDKAKEYYQKAVADPSKINPNNLKNAQAMIAAIK
jgi:tetratricopeptide (TPR) repeat protein